MITMIFRDVLLGGAMIALVVPAFAEQATRAETRSEKEANDAYFAERTTMKSIVEGWPEANRTCFRKTVRELTNAIIAGGSTTIGNTPITNAEAACEPNARKHDGENLCAIIGKALFCTHGAWNKPISSQCWIMGNYKSCDGETWVLQEETGRWISTDEQKLRDDFRIERERSERPI